MKKAIAIIIAATMAACLGIAGIAHANSSQDNNNLKPKSFAEAKTNLLRIMKTSSMKDIEKGKMTQAQADCDLSFIETEYTPENLMPMLASGHTPGEITIGLIARMLTSCGQI